MEQGIERESGDDMGGQSDAARAILAQVEEAGAISDAALRGTLDEMDLSDQQVEEVYRALDAADVRIVAEDDDDDDDERPALDLTAMFNAFEPIFDLLQPADINQLATNIVEVPVRSLASILSEHGLKQIDYMSIDVEGGENDILDSLATSGVVPVALTLENNYASRDLRAKVEALGMLKVHELEADDVYVRRGVLSDAKVRRLQLGYLINPRRIAERQLAPLARRILPAGLAAIARKGWQRVARHGRG